MDGDVAPLERIVELAQRYDARVMVDEAHATGVLGPGGRGSVAAAGLEGEVDVIVGTLGKALGSYGAYVCCDAAMARYLVNTARTLIFSTGPAPPVVAGGAGGARALREQPRRVERLRRNARTLRDALGEQGLAVPAGETPIVPLVVGDAARAMALCERALRAGRVRAGDPAADGARGQLAAAPRRDGDPQRGRARVGALRSSAPPHARPAPRSGLAQPHCARRHPVRPRRMPRSAAARCAGCSSPGPTRRSARPSSLPRSPPTLAGARRARVGLQAGGHGPRGDRDGPRRPRSPARGRALAAAAADVAPYRFGPPVSPHLAAGGQASGRPLPAAARPRGAPAPGDVLVAEGVGGLLVPLARRYLVRDLAADLGLPLVIAARPGLGTISHTLMTLECARAAGLDVPAVVLTPWPAVRREMERSNRETIARLGASRSRPCRTWTSGASHSTPGLTCRSSVGSRRAGSRCRLVGGRFRRLPARRAPRAWRGPAASGDRPR